MSSNPNAPDATPPDAGADLSPPGEDGSADGVSPDSGSSSSGTSSSGKAPAADENGGSGDSGSTRGKGNAKGQIGKSGNSGAGSSAGSADNNDGGDNNNGGNDNSGGDDSGDTGSAGKRTDSSGSGDDNGDNNNANGKSKGKSKGNNNNNDGGSVNGRNANPSNVRQADDQATDNNVDDSAPSTDGSSPAGPTKNNNGDTSDPSGNGAVNPTNSPQENVPQVDSGNKGGIPAGVIIGAMLFGTILVVTLIVCIVRRKTRVMGRRQARKSYRLNDDDNDLFAIGQPFYEENGRFTRGSVTEPSAAAARASSVYIDELEPVGGGYVPPTNPEMGYAPTQYQNVPYSPYTSPPPSAPPYAPPVSLRPMSRFGVPSPVRVHSPSPFPPEYTSRPATPYTADHFPVDHGGFSRQNYNNGAPYKC